MAQDGGNKKPRELLDLVVNEVSLVDLAANKRKFLVVKRLGGAEMPNFLDDITAAVSAVVEKQQQQADVEKALPADLAKAIKDLMEWLKKAGSMEGAPKDAIARVTDFLGKVAGGSYPYPSPGAGNGGKPMQAKKEKEEDEDVEKSKRFTGKRIEDLKGSIEKLFGLLKEVDEEGLKALFEKASKAGDEEEDKEAKEKGKAKGKGEPQANANGDEDPEEKNKGKVKKAADFYGLFEEISKRLEKIEKTRAPSQGGEPSTPVKKGGDFWKGVL